MLIALALLPVALRLWKDFTPPWGGTSTWRSGPSIDQIRKLSTLVTARATISDAQETTLHGRLGGCRAVLVIKGEALLGPDLARAKIIATDPKARLMTLELPRPRVVSARLDHGATRVTSLHSQGLWLMVLGDAGRTRVLNDALRQAQEAVARAASSPDLAERARDHAEIVLRDFFATGGWRVQIKWIGSP